MTAEAAQANDFNMTIGSLRHQRRARTALVIATTALLLLANGCASLVNTPAQDVAWNRWRTCQTEATGTEIRTVQLDGRIVFWYFGPGDRQPCLIACGGRRARGRRSPNPSRTRCRVVPERHKTTATGLLSPRVVESAGVGALLCGSAGRLTAAACLA
jgi:hypothetical protein